MEPGHVLISRVKKHYRLVNKIDQGGLGIVFSAIDLATGQTVAVKLWHTTTYPNGVSLTKTQRQQQFTREIRILEQLRHPNALTLLDHGQTEKGQCFAVFPLLPGHTLKEWIIRLGSLPAVQAGNVMTLVLNALMALHTQGIAHGDLKPHNIMVDGLKTGLIRITLLDFGNATWLTQVPMRQTPALCSPAYSPPEQLLGSTPNIQSDLYAWALVFLECLTGQPAITGHNAAEIRYHQMSSTPVPIPKPLQNHALGHLLTRALQKDYTLRVTNSEVLLQSLVNIDLQDLPLDLYSPRKHNVPDECCPTQP